MMLFPRNAEQYYCAVFQCLFLYDENNKEETEAQRDLLFLWHLDAAMFKPGLNDAYLVFLWNKFGF